ncbi:MAG TPA: histidine kinase dimerization/phospho-acceptor domain-containing protein [Chitinispirillaceae bacterium]|nr:histidine kinase dimerization/phospho-acceptor domain-containing protein [Chitinispirillaceae bacterium]
MYFFRAEIYNIKMRVNIGPKLFIGFLVVIFLNVFFLVIVSKTENVNGITRILKRQNEIKNDMLRLKTLHKIQGPSIISYQRVGRLESVENFQEIHNEITTLIGAMDSKVDTIQLLDSIFSQSDINGQNDGSISRLKKSMIDIRTYNDLYAGTFDSIVKSKNAVVDPKKLQAWGDLINDVDQKLSETIDSAENIIDQQTNLRIKEVEARVANVKQITIVIIAGVTLFAILFGWIFSKYITNALRRLKEFAGHIAKGDFNVDPTGYPSDEIGDVATAFFEMSIDLKNTQEELIKSKRLAAIGEIVASVNHEINNPLMIISGNAQFLEMLMENSPAEIKERIHTIIEETERISRVTRKLREIKNPVVEDYTSSGEQMINLDKSSL